MHCIIEGSAMGGKLIPFAVEKNSANSRIRTRTGSSRPALYN